MSSARRAAARTTAGSQASPLRASRRLCRSERPLPSPASAQDKSAHVRPRRRWPSAARPCARIGLALDVVARNRRARHQAMEVRPACELGAVLRRLGVLWLAHLHREAVAALWTGYRTGYPVHPVHPVRNHRLDIGFLARLGGEHEGGGERHVHLCEGRVGAFHRARPQPRDHGELLALIWF